MSLKNIVMKSQTITKVQRIHNYVFIMPKLTLFLYDTLRHHSFRYFHEACDISAFYIIDIFAIFTVSYALFVDCAHDLM